MWVGLLAFGIPLIGGVKVLQISDIHVSHYHTESAANLKRFCEGDFKLISSQVDIVVLSGDLTDASPPFLSFTPRGQKEEDWKLLEESFAACLAGNKPIFSVRGNHDGFGVSEFSSGSNSYYRNFHASLATRRSQLEKVAPLDVTVHGEQDGTQVLVVKDETVVLLDSLYNTGVARHFFGYFPESIDAWLDGALSKVGKATSRITCISHYPIGTYKQPDRVRLSEFLRRHKVASFHAGHLHTILGRPMMTEWTLESPEGEDQHTLVEHEIADFKKKEIVRVIDTATLIVYDFGEKTKESVSEYKDRKYSLNLSTAKTDDGNTNILKTDDHKIMQTKYKTLGALPAVLFKYFQETIDGIALAVHSITLLLALFMYLRGICGVENFFIKTNLILVGLLPIMPLCFTQVFAGSVGINFWWGGVSHRGISSNDTVASDIVFLDIQIGLAMLVLFTYSKLNQHIAVRIIGGLLVTVACIPSIVLNLYRGGGISIISLSLVWAVFFWLYSPIGFNWSRTRVSDKQSTVA